MSAQQGSKPQQGSSGYASQDSRATEYALADRLTASNKSESVLPNQQDGLVSKVVNKLLPGTSSNQSENSETDNAAAGVQGGVHRGGVWSADSHQALNNSTGGCSRPCACCACSACSACFGSLAVYLPCWCYRCLPDIV